MVSSKIVIYIILTFVCLFFMFPIYWIVITSLKNEGLIYVIPPVFSPKGFTFANYKEAIATKPILKHFLNSLEIACISTGLSVVVSVLAGFGFSRYRFRGRIASLYSILIAKMVPGVILLIPYYMLFKKINLLNNKLSLIITYTAINLPFSIWLIMGFFDDIPVEIFESGKLDGCNEWKLFIRLGLPFSVPGIISTAILDFIYCWNEFLLALVLTYSESVQTLPITVSGFLDTTVATPMGALAAVGTLALLPTLILSVLTQKHIVSGLSAGAVKG